MRRILLLSDTHGCLDDFIVNQLHEIDELWHAGDIGGMEWLKTIESLSLPFSNRFVFGNIDDNMVRIACPEWQLFTIDHLKFLILHIGGNIKKVSEKARDLIHTHKPDVFICGHSHILQVKWMEVPGKFLFMNPGAAGISGFHKVRTMLRFEIVDGRLQNLKVIQKEKSSNKES